MNHYLFSVARLPKSVVGGPKPARQILIERIEQGRWPLNGGTSFQQELREGDRVLLYFTSKDEEGAQFAGTCEIGGGRVPSQRSGRSRGAWPSARAVSLYDVPIRNARLFEVPVPIRPLIGRLSLIKDPDKWGMYLQGGVRRISEADYALVVASAGR